MSRYLLDTNVFVHLVRDDATAQRLKSEQALLLAEEVPVYSVVTEGEIRSLSYQFGWGDDRLRSCFSSSATSPAFPSKRRMCRRLTPS